MPRRGGTALLDRFSALETRGSGPRCFLAVVALRE